jgi:hypothetical protein
MLTVYLLVICSNVVSPNQQFRIHSKTSLIIDTTPTAGLALTCKKVHAEHSNLLRATALSPGKILTTTIYNFDFTDLITFVRALRPYEIAAANRNQNLVVNLWGWSHEAVDLRTLADWLCVSRDTGLEAKYVCQWTSNATTRPRRMDEMLRSTTEGRKIMRALDLRNIRSWNWELYRACLEEGCC